MSNLTTPYLPTELWMLWVADGAMYAGAIDAAGDPMLCFLCRRDAEDSARSHKEIYDMDCIPVKVFSGIKPTPDMKARIDGLEAMRGT